MRSVFGSGTSTVAAVEPEQETRSDGLIIHPYFAAV